MDFAQLPDDLRRKATNTLRFLAIDGVEKAKSGHPGLPMGASEMAFVLWTEFLRFNPHEPGWMGRDRFVLSPGHGSMLLYSLLHLFEYGLTIDDLQHFRQWGSKTPGHPEYRHTVGVETTTGPLGAGISTAVGMAIAQKHLAAVLNTPDFSPITGHIWGICSDGDLMEGISAEAASIAGHLKLGNMKFLYDSNRITIDGSTEIAFTEDVGKRFEAYGWHVLHVDGENHNEVRKGLSAARDVTDRPSLVIAHTTIAYGAATMAGKAKTHGSPLGADEIARTRAALNWPAQTFYVPDEVRELCRTRVADNKAEFDAWNKSFAAWRQTNPEKARLWDTLMEQPLPSNLEAELIAAAGPTAGVATRTSGGKVLNRAAQLVPAIIGGSADLDESTMTFLKDMGVVQHDSYAGRNIHWGIREHAMGAAVNGLMLFGGTRPFSATFLTFSDYMRPSIRLAALMRIPSVFVFTHDSVFLGEDGPTHQSIEQTPSLRLIPHLDVWRPGDSREVALAWAGALQRKDGPSTIILTRHKLTDAGGVNAQVPQTADEAAAYIAHEPEGGPKAVVIATGSEMAITVQAAKLAPELRIRVVSMPCVERFARRSKAEQEALLPRNLPIGAVEASKTDGWHKFTGREGIVIGVDEYGQSAPTEVIAEKLGFTPPAIAQRLKDWLV
jgi:transketolase